MTRTEPGNSLECHDRLGFMGLNSFLGTRHGLPGSCFRAQFGYGRAVVWHLYGLSVLMLGRFLFTG